MPRIGITLSHRFLEQLHLNEVEALHTALTFNFAHIRLCVYWDESERQSGEFNFSKIERMLRLCEAAKQHVVVTIGIKAPRWPEFYFPPYVSSKDPHDKEVQARALIIIKKAVQTLCTYKCITHWQIENEPLDPSGSQNQKIPSDFLMQEISLLKKMDKRPILLTCWGNELLRRDVFSTLEHMGDVVGIDLYFKVYVRGIMGISFYSAPKDDLHKIQQRIKKSLKPVWITELQAEPWEKNEDAYLSKNPKSMNLRQLQKNIEAVRDLPVEEIFFWGFEYWLYRFKQGDSSYFEMIKNLTNN